MDLRPFYFNALDNAARIVGGVDLTQLSGETPCEGWDTRTLMNHLVDGVWLFSKAIQGEAVDPSQTPPDLVADDPSSAFKAAQTAALEAWNAEGVLEGTATLWGGMPSTLALRIALMEAVVHGWDLAKATGQDTGIEPMVAAAMLDGLRKTITPEQRASGIFGPEVSVPEDAPIEDQLVAFLGRKPS